MDKQFKKALRELRGSLLASILLIIIVSSILLSVNYYTIKINASIRAYIHGESMYSKGQKDAARYLSEFVYSSDTSKIALFKKAISIPRGDGLARVSLENKEDYSIAKSHLLQGNNHPDDIVNLIWLFNNFIELPFMQKAYTAWHQADTLILELESLADFIFHEKQSRALTDEENWQYLYQISDLNDKLTEQQLFFSRTLGDAGRKAEEYLFYFNFFVILLILVTTIYAIYGLVKRLVLQNTELKIINGELDRFVYSASHDLRSPISSLKGLVEVMKAEKDAKEFSNYLQKMKEVLDRQDLFLKDIIDFSKSRRLNNNVKVISADEMVNQVIGNHQYMKEAENISFQKNVGLDKFVGDESRILIILNNLISNAVKYHDQNKSNRFIKISVYNSKQHHIAIQVKDNGIGIKPEFKDRIFDMFFVVENKNKGSGLGLYIVADALEKINGEIKVDSELLKGSTFLVEFPESSLIGTQPTN